MRTSQSRPAILVAMILASTLTALAPAADLYVSPAGKDAAAGSKQSPVATLTRARDLARDIRRDKPTEPITVWLASGDYYLPDTFELSAGDAGVAGRPTFYRNVEGASPRLIGGRLLPKSAMKPITDSETLARIEPALRGKIVQVDIAGEKIRNAKRPKDVFTDEGGFFALFVNEKRLPISRFPNTGYLTIKTVLDTGGGIQNKDWRNPVMAPKPKDGGTFEYREDAAAQAERWAKVLDHGVWLKGFWRIPWQNDATRIKSIDTSARTITFAKALPGGIGNKYTRPTGNGQERYWLLNLLEAVDQPGEWAVDTKDDRLYFYPPDSADSKIVLADSDGPVIRLANTHDIIIQGIEINSARGDGIEIKDGQNNVVAGCTIRNVNLYAVRVDGGKNHVVQSSDMFDLGSGGVWLGGGDENATPRVPAAHRVVNNHIYRFSQVTRVYTPGVNCGFSGGGGGGHHAAVGMYVAHNLIHDTPHAGVLSGSWDNLFEFNEVFRFCTVSNDMGAFYCYDWYDKNGHQTFRYNFCHSSPEGDGIYFDNDHRDMTVYGNIVYLKSRGARGTGFLYKIGTQDKNPQTIDCRNNIAIDCKYGFEFVSAKPGESRIENNAAVDCRTDFTWKTVDGKKTPTVKPYATGPMKTYAKDPGFMSLAKLDVRLRSGAAVFRDMPGFEKIPVEKIGLYVDQYRTKLPSAGEIDREGKRASDDSLGYDIKDRQ